MTIMGNKPEWQPGGLDLLGSVEMADGAGICPGQAEQLFWDREPTNVLLYIHNQR